MRLIRSLLSVAATCCIGSVALAQDTINVVGIYALSGPASVYGAGAEKALRLMIDALPNKSINGKPVKLTIYDTEGNSTKAAQNLRRAVENDNAQIVFGPSTSGEALAIAPIANQLKVPVITNAGAEAVTKPVTPYMFATGPTDRLMVEAIVASMLRQGMKNIAIIYSQDGYGQSGGTISQELVKAAGLNVVVAETFAPQDTNMTAQLLRIRDKNPDAIIMWSSNPGPTIVAKNAKELGMKVPFFVSTANATIAFITQTGDAADGITATTLPVVAPEALADNDPRKAIIMRFAKLYGDKYGQPADQAAGLGLDNFLLLEGAVKSINGPVTRETVRAALESLKMCGANGCRQVRPDDHRGLTRDAVVMMKMLGGKFVLAQ